MRAKRSKSQFSKAVCGERKVVAQARLTAAAWLNFDAPFPLPRQRGAPAEDARGPEEKETARGNRLTAPLTYRVARSGLAGGGLLAGAGCLALD